MIRQEKNKKYSPKRIVSMVCIVFWLMCVIACPVGAVPDSNSETTDYEDVTIVTSPTQPTESEKNNPVNDLLEDASNNIMSGVNHIHGDSVVHIDQMNDIALYWYKVVRNYIAVPLMILSFASCGYKFFLCAIMTKPEYAVDETKKQFINTIILMFVLFAIPMVMSIVRNITEATRWIPPQ